MASQIFKSIQFSLHPDDHMTDHWSCDNMPSYAHGESSSMIFVNYLLF